MEKEELLTDVGFALVISGLLAATFTFQYVGSCGEPAYVEIHEAECGIYPQLFYAGVLVGGIGFAMVAVGVIASRRDRSPPGNGPR